MIESTCGRGKAAYSDCARRQLDALQASPGAPDLSAISGADQRMIESACSGDRYMNGPAAYYNCLRRQQAGLQASPGAPDVSGISGADQEMIESACGSDRFMHGPAAYYDCVRQQLAALRASLGAPDLSAVSDADRRKIALACGTARSTRGPAAYYYCLRQQASALSASRPATGVAEPAKSASNLPQQAPQGPPSQATHAAREDAKVRQSKARSSESPAQPAGTQAAPNAQVDSPPNSARQPNRSRIGDLTAGLVVLLAGGALAGFLYKRATRKKCVLCGRSVAATGPYCSTCFNVVAEAAVRAAEEQAMAEEERRARLPRRNATSSNGAFDPYAVLGINRDASQEQIRAAYRREIVNCHPDKVVHLGEEFQEIAKTKAQDINRAYAALAQSQ